MEKDFVMLNPLPEGRGIGGIIKDDKGKIIGGEHKIKWKVKEYDKGDGDFGAEILAICIDGTTGIVYGKFPDLMQSELMDLKRRLEDD